MRQRVIADKRKKMSAENLKRLAYAAVLIATATLISLAILVLPKQFKITKVTVEDANPALTEKVKVFAMELINKERSGSDPVSIFKVPREKLEKELLKEFSPIHTVQILRELPGTVHINIQEKVPTAVFLINGTYFLVDPDGVAFDTIPQENIKKDELILIKDERADRQVGLGSSIVSADFLATIHDIFRQLPERFNIKPEETVISSVGIQELDIKTTEGWTLKLDMERPVSEQFEVLDKIFTEEIDAQKRTRLDYLDLRVKDRGIYMLK